MKEDWQTKMKRAELALAELRRSYLDTGGHISSDHADLAQLAFLNFCNQMYHLRDYLVEVGVTFAIFDKFVEISNYFHFCAKIATLDKHQAADRPLWVSKNNVSGSNRNITFDLPTPGTKTPFLITRPRFEYTVDGVKIDALVAAEEAWKEFGDFINQMGLRVS